MKTPQKPQMLSEHSFNDWQKDDLKTFLGQFFIQTKDVDPDFIQVFELGVLWLLRTWEPML